MDAEFNITAEFAWKGLLVFLLSILGIVSNSVAAGVLLRKKEFRNSFGLLAAFLTVANVLLLLIVLIWAAPQIVVQLPSQLLMVDLRIGQVELLLVEIAFHMSFALSLNRFFAISFPTFYANYFDRKVAVGILILTISYSTSYTISYCADAGPIHLTTSIKCSEVSGSSCNQYLEHITSKYNCILFGVVAITNVMTLFFLKSTNRSLRTSPDYCTRKAKKEKNLFFQALLISVFYSFMLVSYHFINEVAETEFLKFLTSTVAWLLSHCATGLILIMFNREISRTLRRQSLFPTRQNSLSPDHAQSNAVAPAEKPPG